MSRPKVPRDGGDTTTVEGALELLRQNGGRITSSRRFLLRLLFESEGHHAAEELAAEVQAQAPDIHLSTIYRNLDELEKLRRDRARTLRTRTCHLSLRLERPWPLRLRRMRKDD